ncbi:MAG: Phosphoribosyl-AMP cyclohydrolase [Candidatus Thorarchaeota archaeon]|nr:MAG: Phosphoribosyl-AMP cyclohydrolase [Candidatus Thorarchaeota archaeon]
MKIEIAGLDFEKGDGLIPVVVQEARTLEVLTLAYTNRAALVLTQSTGYAHYYRRSKGRVMKKGVTSGNVQKIVSILTDCDNDALVFLVDQMGPACHLNERTCFHKTVQ